MALIRELVGVTKSSKQPLQLAEFTENKWSFNNSNSSITLDLKPSKDGCINELKYDNKLVRATTAQFMHTCSVFAQKIVLAVSHM